jgi:tRNA G18 (ribose-2'-O)-methylase SpoU
VSRTKTPRTTARGFFEVGIYHGKTEVNLGTLLRSAYQLGAAGVFTVGRRYRRQASDTCKAWRHFPVRHFATLDEAIAGLPMSCPLVGVEMGGTPLGEFAHPERAAYLLGAEDDGLPDAVMARCHHVVSLGSVRVPSFNVAVAGSIVMYDRVFGWSGAGQEAA